MSAKKTALAKKEQEIEQIREEIVHLKSSPLYKERMKNNVFPVVGECGRAHLIHR
jgi:hypothetical protein